MIVSTNLGETFSATAASPSSDQNDALAVVDENLIWVGDDAGNLFYTLDGGETWTQKEFPGDGAGGVHDIVIATNEVLYVSHSDATPAARLFTSFDGGRTLTNQSPRLNNLPTIDRINRIAVPKNTELGVTANNVAIAGLAANGTDGIMLIGTVPVR